MHYQTIRIILYSSLAIVLLALVWGWRETRIQGRLADQALHESLEQEMVVLNGAVKASVQAMKYRLLDVLKAEGNDHPTRTFQDSPFFAATLLEWDQVQWRSLWYSVKSKTDLQADHLPNWLQEWPLSKLAPDEVYLTRIGEVEGQAYFAILVPVRKPNQIPMIGVGIFPAAEFGLNFSADENREIRVFNQEGFALALSHPAYLGAVVKSEPLVREMLGSDEVIVHHEWQNERGTALLGMATRIPDTNLYAAIETKAAVGSTLQSWLYLLLSATGAVGLNWVLFNAIFKPLLGQLSQNDELTEQLRKQLSEKLNTEPDPHSVMVENAPLAALEFQEDEVPIAQPEESVVDQSPSLHKVMQAALRTMHGKIQEHAVHVHAQDLSAFPLDGDAAQLQTAIEEVLKNAIEAMATTTVRELTVVAQKSDGRLRLSIEDTGCGIAAGDLDKVFDPFFSTKDTQGVARGLGLNVVRRVIEELSGSVKLQNRFGGGTCVEIDWPAEPESRREEVPPAAPRIEPEWPEVTVRRPKVRNLD